MKCSPAKAVTRDQQAAAGWIASLVLLLLAAPQAASAIAPPAVWLPATGGRVPAGAFVGGSEDGARIHVCRGRYAEELRFGKVSGDACAIGGSGREIALARFEVLFDNGDLEWIAPREASSRLSPARAGEASSAGWICRVKYRGGVHPGEVAGDRCRIAWRGTEILRDDYDVLSRVVEAPADAVRIAEAPPAENAAEASAPGDVAERPIPLTVPEEATDTPPAAEAVVVEVDDRARPVPAPPPVPPPPAPAPPPIDASVIGTVTRAVVERPVAERRIPETMADLIPQVGHGGVIDSAQFTPDGRRAVTASSDGTVRLWDVETGKEMGRVGGTGRPLKTSMALSGDGHIAYSSYAQWVVYWDVRKREYLGTLEPDIGWVKNLAAAADGRHLLIDGRGGMCIVEMNHGEPPPAAPKQEEPTTKKKRRTKKKETPRTRKKNRCFPIGAISVDLSPDGSRLVTSGLQFPSRVQDGQFESLQGAAGTFGQTRKEARQNLDIQVWNVGTKASEAGRRTQLSKFRLDKGPAKTETSGATTNFVMRAFFGLKLGRLPVKVQFSPDGQTVLSGHGNGWIALWTLDGKLLRAFAGHDGMVVDLVMSHDQRYIASSGGDATVKLWEAGTGRLVRQLEGHEAGVTSLAVTRDNRYVLATSVDRSVILWELASGKIARRMGQQVPRASFARFRPDGLSFVTGGRESAKGRVREWSLADGSLRRVYPGHQGGVSAASYSPDGLLLATGGADFRVRIWETVTGSLISEFRQEANDTLIKRSKKYGGSPNEVIEGRTDEFLDPGAELWGFRSVAFSPNGSKLAGAPVGGGAVTVWDVASGSVAGSMTRGKLRTLSGSGADSWALSKDGATDVAFSPRGDTVAQAAGSDVETWNASKTKAKPTKFGAAYESDFRSASKDRHKQNVNSVEYSPDGKYVLSGSADGSAVAWDPNRRARVVELKGRHNGGVNRATYHPSGRQVATASDDSTIKLWDVATGEVLKTLTGHQAPVRWVEFSPDGRRLLSTSSDGSTRLWDGDSGEEIVRLIEGGDSEYILATPDNFYLASKGASQSVAFVYQDQVYPFEQFDLRLNRPDIVLERLGAARPELIDAYYRAYQKRLSKMGFSEEMLGDDFHVPTAKVDRTGVELSSVAKTVTLSVSAADTQYDLDRLNVYVNDVPIYGHGGIDLRPEGTRALAREIELELSNGRNKIQISVHNARGAESLRDTLEIEYTGAPAPADLHVVVIGVSEYLDPAITDLRFAAKDAADIAEWFGRGGRRFRDVRIHRLLDGQATRERILALKEHLMASGADDQVVLFLAGHGFLDSKLDYYFATADMVAADPAARGLPYQEIEDLLDGIPARNKLLLMDTCHAGEVDKDDTELVAAAAPGSGAGAGGASRGAVSVRRKEKGIGLPSSFALMQGLFVNLSRGSGAVAIAAAGGAEYAFENDKWGNGAFTYSVLEGLESGKADSNGDGEIRVTELRDYVAAQVSELTQGRQQPTARRENVENDFPVYALVPGGG